MLQKDYDHKGSIAKKEAWHQVASRIVTLTLTEGSCEMVASQQ
jgi:hypothetical protein